jgi:hypothetical protein
MNNYQTSADKHIKSSMFDISNSHVTESKGISYGSQSVNFTSISSTPCSAISTINSENNIETSLNIFHEEQSPPQLNLAESNVRQVNGTIIAIEDISIICEVSLPTEIKEFRFPKSLFEFEPFIGKAVSVQFDVVNGIRKVLVSERTADTEKVSLGRNEIQNLVDKF